MGATLPKAVEAAVVERQGAKGWGVAVAEVNGWRTNMEDAHVIHLRDDWAFFGVFDGHGGQACSAFVSQRFHEELELKGCPKDDAAVKQLVLGIDKEFMDSEQPSGSTGTMCIVHKPSKAGDRHILRVINAGDSRVLLGRRDGTIVDGGGTDKGLTIDHKPDHPSERERIERCGGTVEMKEGNVARVNGDLAVSRSFGDRDYKKTGGPGPEDRPVTADPEMFRFECDETDFLLLVCDGVSEGSFPNAEVVKFVADQLNAGVDPGVVARLTCLKAIEKDSKDNITCMIVQLTDASEMGKRVEFVPGPVAQIGHKGFRSAYESMAQRGGLTLAQAVARRYEMVQQELQKASADSSEQHELQQELAKLGKTPPEGAAGSPERDAFFGRWLSNLPSEGDDGGMPGGLSGLGDLDIESLLGNKGKGKGLGPGPDPEAAAARASPSTSSTRAPSSEDATEKAEDGYSWSQQGEEVQITFKLDRPAAKKDVKVDFKPSGLTVAVGSSTLLDGALGGKVETDECTWCLASAGAELQVMLTKKEEKENWKTLLK